MEEIQSTLNKAAQNVLEVSRSVAQWGQKRFEHFELKSRTESRHVHHIRKTERATESSNELFLIILLFLIQFEYACIQ